MSAMGYAFVVIGGLLLRQVMVGRATDIPTDIRDLSLGFLNGDMGTVQEVFTRRGSNVPGASVSVVASPLAPGTPLITAVQTLGNAAKGYRLGSTGPDYYDCSGLIWAAMKQTGIYTGARFTTRTFSQLANKNGWEKVAAPTAGDIILWPGEHMGIALGNNGMYSARSTSKGIGVSSVSGDSGYFGFSPDYYRVS